MQNANSINDEDYWDKRFAENWEDCDGPKQSRFFAKLAISHLPRWLLDQIHRKRLTLVDWGCAQGDGTDVLASHFDADKIIGVDFSLVAIEEASQRYPSIRFVAEDWVSEEHSSLGTVDVVFSSNTLEHFYRPYEVLQKICRRADKAVILALPYRELDRIDEHFSSFLPENIPTVLPNGFRLVWSQVVDCRGEPETYWGGDQIIVVYAEPAWTDSLALKLTDYCVVQEDSKASIVERDSQIASLNEAMADRDRQIAGLNQAVIERDAWLSQYAEILKQLHSSTSWRLTAPLRSIKRALFSFDRARRHADHNSKPTGSASISCAVWRQRLSYLVSRLRNGVQRHGLIRSIPLSIRASRQLGSLWFKKRLRNREYEQRLLELGSIIERHEGFVDLFHVPMGWSTPLFQRFQHMSLQAAKLGGLALYGGHLQVDTDLFVYKKAEGDVIVFDALDQKVIDRVFESLRKTGQPKILRLQSIDLATTRQNIESFLSDGITVVYEYIDEISEEITGAIPAFVIERHKWLLQDSRIITVATSDKLFDEVCRHRSQNCLLSTNGVDLEHWRKMCPVPPSDMEPAVKSGRIVVGYHGALASWIDYELLRKIAEDDRFEVVLIGYPHDSSLNDSGILGHPRIHYLGSKSYFALNKYASFYDIGILPFRRYELTESVSPVKLFEYMAADKPLVTTDLRECYKYPSCLVSNSHEAFLENLHVAALARSDDRYRSVLKGDAERNSWREKAVQMFLLAGVEIGEGARLEENISGTAQTVEK